jgi:hypothetical protein
LPRDARQIDDELRSLHSCAGRPTDDICNSAPRGPARTIRSGPQIIDTSDGCRPAGCFKCVTQGDFAAPAHADSLLSRKTALGHVRNRSGGRSQGSGPRHLRKVKTRVVVFGPRKWRGPETRGRVPDGDAA